MAFEFGEWTPDLPAVGIKQLRKARNVLASDAISYGPFPGLETSFNAVDSRCTGTYAARQQDGLIRLFAGTQTKLYQTLVGPTWNDVSKSGNYLSLANPWKFDQLDFRVFATNFEDPIQTWLLASDTEFSDLSAAAPKAKYITTWFPGFLAAAYTNDTTDGIRPSRVWWPAYQDPTNWPTPGSADAQAAQSDFRDLSKGGLITGLTGPVGGASGAVFCQEAIYRVDYEGPPTVFRILDVETDRGTNAPQSIVSIGSMVFYLGNDGFYMFNGTNSVPIGSMKVDATFWRDLHQGFLDRVYGVADPINKIVMWLYPSNGTDGTPDKVLAYNWEVGRWSEAEVNVELIAQYFTPSYTIDNIDGFGDIDTILPSLDSRAWLGGSQSLVAFTLDDKLAFFTGDSLEAELETGEMYVGNGRSSFVERVYSYVDGGDPVVRGGFRDVQLVNDSNVQYTDFKERQRDGTHVLRTRGKYQRFGVKIPAGGSWRHASGLDVDAKDDGI